MYLLSFQCSTTERTWSWSSENRVCKPQCLTQKFVHIKRKKKTKLFCNREHSLHCSAKITTSIGCCRNKNPYRKRVGYTYQRFGSALPKINVALIPHTRPSALLSHNAICRVMQALLLLSVHACGERKLKRARNFTSSTQIFTRL